MTATLDTIAPPDLNAKLRDAKTEADRLRAEFAAAEQDRTEAADRHDYPAAEEANARIDALLPHLALAGATEAALTEAVKQLQAQQEKAQAAARQQARRAAAEEAIGAAVQAEQEARETAERHLAAALAGVDAVRASVILAKQAEQTGTEARQAAAQARSELDGTPMPMLVRSNWVSGRIDHDPVLAAVLGRPGA